MAFYKEQYNEKFGVWYPQAIIVGKPISTKQIAERLAKISTVSLADVLADEQASGGRMARFVINDRTVYTRLSQFKKEAARKLAAQWLKGATQLRNMQAQLDAMRRQYGTRRDASLRRSMGLSTRM